MKKDQEKILEEFIKRFKEDPPTREGDLIMVRVFEGKLRVSHLSSKIPLKRLDKE